MKCVVQRVRSASVSVEGTRVSEIASGLLLLVGVERGDGDRQLQALAKKVLEMRIFSDADGKMNLDLKQAGGAILAVSQFTLAASLERGRRPAFTNAEDPAVAREMFDRFCQLLREGGVEVQTGRFGEMMLVALENDGPVTFILEMRSS